MTTTQNHFTDTIKECPILYWLSFISLGLAIIGFAVFIANSQNLNLLPFPSYVMRFLALCYAVAGSYLITISILLLFTYKIVERDKKVNFLIKLGIFVFILAAIVYFYSPIINKIFECFSIEYRIKYSVFLNSILQHKITIIVGSILGTLSEEYWYINFNKKGLIYSAYSCIKKNAN